MTWYVKLVILVGAALIVLQAIAPLALFIEESAAGGISSSVRVEGESVVVELEYNMSVPIKDVIVEVTFGNATASTSIEELSLGDRVEVALPLEVVDETGSLKLRIEGVIGGLYRFNFEVVEGEG